MKNNRGSAGIVGATVLGIIMLIVLIGLGMNAKRVPVGYEGVVYNMNGGVQGETLSQGWHLVSPTKKVKLFTVGNEQIVLTKDKREGSKSDDSFYVSTADNASIKISFQMSYRYNQANLVDTYKKFKGMDGEDIVEKRVKSVLKSKISEITTDYSMMDIYSGNRSEINGKITEYLADNFLEDYGIEVMDASIIDAHPDKQLKKAINAKVKALQQKEQAEAEQQTAKVNAETAKIEEQAKADRALIAAKAEADKKILEAEAEAKANKIVNDSITDKLLKMQYLEKWDGALPKVSGNNDVMLGIGDIND